MDSQYVDTRTATFWEERNKLALGIHPSQIKRRINYYFLKKIGIELDITGLDFDYQDPRVGVYTNKQFFGIFNYANNYFEDH